MDDFSSTLTIPYHNNKHQSRKIFLTIWLSFSTCKMLQKMVDFSQAKSEAEAEKRRLAERKERLLLKADDHGEAGGSV